MKKTFFSLFVAVALLSACTNTTNTATVNLDTTVDSVSFAIGSSYGGNINRQLTSLGDTNLNYDAMILGFTQALKELDLDIEEDLGNEIINAYMQKKDEAKKQVDRDKFSGNISVGEAFLKENKTKEGIIETVSGLQYEVITLGEGEMPIDGDVVKVHYTGSLLDGQVFDSSVDKGDPIVHPVNRFIPGWTEGLKLMPVGSTFKFYIPSTLAYGENPPQGSNIEPYSTLVFTVELIGIEK
jgi:FKBP-type peptidyl-prolyl cis-trans isomerase